VKQRTSRRPIEESAMALRPGQVRDAIFNYFDEHDGAVGTLQDIRGHAQRLIGRDVPPSSVRSYLQLSKEFKRVGRGAYRRVR